MNDTTEQSEPESPDVPTYVPTRLRKTVVVYMTNGIPMIIGTLDPSVHELREFITFEHPLFGPIQATLKSTTARTVTYAQVQTAR
jgi:hypothetical protein